MADKPLIQFETPAEGLRVKCGNCQQDQFYLAIHAKLGGAMVYRTAECASCGEREAID
jgi:hypothetical protein